MDRIIKMNRLEHEEYLEQLWYMRETEKDSIEELASRIHGEFGMPVLERMRERGLVDLTDDRKRVSLTSQGVVEARAITRRHRLAERLLYDVLGMTGDAFEAGACEFEHVLAPELVDSICILLGHPRECPHGRPIPKGKCCERSLRHVQCAPCSLAELKVSDAARVAFLKSEDDGQIHRLDGLHIRPGSILRMRQTFPCFVIECEGARIALEEKVARNIYVWVEGAGAEE